jgi:glycosyltransferase involved in cell wall biosynthesis
MVRQHRIDVVNAHWMVPQGLTAALLRGTGRTRFRLALHAHAGDVYLLRSMTGGAGVARYITARTDVAFADGSHVRDTWNELLGRDSRARLQPMGVHTERFCSGLPLCPDEPPARFIGGYVLFVGRLIEKKGTIYLIRALPAVRERHPGLGLVVIGHGPEDGALRDEVAKLGLCEAVRFMGHRPHSDVVRYLRGCRVAVVPSIVDRYGETEGMPTVVVEAMAAGAPVVASAVDGIPDVVRHRGNGWLCRERDPADLAEKLLAALVDAHQSETTHAAEHTARQYDWSQVARNYMDALTA